MILDFGLLSVHYCHLLEDRYYHLLEDYYYHLLEDTTTTSWGPITTFAKRSTIAIANKYSPSTIKRSTNISNRGWSSPLVMAHFFSRSDLWHHGVVFFLE
jgi:serine/threonine protein kinase